MPSSCLYLSSRSILLLNVFILHPLVCRSRWASIPSSYWIITASCSLPMTVPGHHFPLNLTLTVAPYPSHSVALSGNLSVLPAAPCFLFLSLALRLIFFVDSISTTVSPKRLMAVHSSMPSVYLRYSPGSPLSSGHSIVVTVAGCQVPGTPM